MFTGSKIYLLAFDSKRAKRAESPRIQCPFNESVSHGARRTRSTRVCLPRQPVKPTLLVITNQ